VKEGLDRASCSRAFDAGFGITRCCVRVARASNAVINGRLGVDKTCPAVYVNEPEGDLAGAQWITNLVLDGHGVRVDGLLAGNAFQSGNDAAIIVLVALHREATFRFASGPRQANVVLL
jgi:hypothetical protein